MFCIKCGKKLPEEAKFCSGCGTKIEQEEIKEEVKIEEPKLEEEIKVQEEIKTVEEKPVQPIKEVPITPQPKNKNININHILIAVIIFFVVVFTLGIGIAAAQKGKGRVVMIYMVGSNLESKGGLATRDLKDLDYNKLKANNTRVVLIAGGTTSWQNNYIDVNETSIYTLESTGFEKVDVRSKNNMGTVDNLSYFLNYVYKNYKAKKYDFIYWNHGGAVDGSEYDDLYSDHLMLIEMSKAFENSPFKNNKKLDVISFRTCLNSTIEVANIYKKYAKYLVASEEVTIGSQADSAIRFLNDVKMSDSPIEYGKKQINTYKEVVTNTCNYSSFMKKDENYCIDSTYSITDLSKIDDVKSKLELFSKDLNKNLSSKYREYSRIRSNMDQYAKDEPAYDMIDLYNFTEKFDKYSNSGKNLRESIEKAVVYNWTNTKHSHGLSIYFPYNNQTFLSSYSDISTSDNYTALITNFYNMKQGIKTNYYSSFSNNSGTVTNKETKQTDVEFELTEEQSKNMTKAGYLIFADTKDGYYQIVYGGSDVKKDGNKLKATVKDRLLRLSDSEYNDDNIWILSREEKIEDDYIDLKAYIYLSNSASVFGNATTATAIIRIDKDHKDGYIKTIYTGFEDKKSNDDTKEFSLFAPTGIKITDYNFVSVLSSRYKLLDENGNYNPDWQSTSNGVIEGKVFRTNKIKFIKEDFKNGYDYYIVFRVFDIANNEYDSKPIKLN